MYADRCLSEKVMMEWNNLEPGDQKSRHHHVVAIYEMYPGSKMKEFGIVCLESFSCRFSLHVAFACELGMEFEASEESRAAIQHRCRHNRRFYL